jgi:hypothetical protein
MKSMRGSPGGHLQVDKTWFELISELSWPTFPTPPGVYEQAALIIVEREIKERIGEG